MSRQLLYSEYHQSPPRSYPEAQQFVANQGTCLYNMLSNKCTACMGIRSSDEWMFSVYLLIPINSLPGWNFKSCWVCSELLEFYAFNHDFHLYEQRDAIISWKFVGNLQVKSVCSGEPAAILQITITIKHRGTVVYLLRDPVLRDSPSWGTVFYRICFIYKYV